MSDASLHGRAAPKTKTINVEANLLSQRLEERLRIKEVVRKRVVVTVAGAVVLATILPPAYRAQTAAAAELKKLASRDTLVTQQLSALQQQQDSIKPVLDDQKTISALHRHAREVLGQITLFLNNVTPTELAISVANVTVAGGQIEIGTTADAVSYQIASDFVDRISKSPNSKQTIVSSMNSNTGLGKEGVTFQLDQKLGVSE